MSTIPLNFYAILTLMLVFFTIWTGRHLAPMRRANEQLNKIDGHDEQEVAPTKARYMLVPLLTMIVGMVGFMLWTGNGDLSQGSGSKSVLYATTLSCVVAYLMLLLSKQYNHQQLVNIGFKGMSELLGLVSILLLALALGQSLKNLGTGLYISGLVAESLPLWLVPAMLFLAGALISFTTGTSWGTFAILIPIGMPLVVNLGLPPPLVLAAILGGGVFGDHCSPISDTTAVSAVAAGCDLLEHTRTQLPYALICAGLALVGYLVCGLVMIE